VIATGAVRDEGLTKELIPPQYPAISDIDVTQALKRAAKESGHRYHVGLYRTGDAFYGLDAEKTFSIWKKAGIKIFEMEAAALLTIASLRGVRAGAIVAVDGPAGSEEAISYELVDHTYFQKAVEAEIRIAIQAIIYLAEADRG
jgi:uridine phosphorylase